jgi:addiction module HigA family antidote
MPMKNPPHPGLSIRYDCLEPLGLSVTQGAKILGVTRQTLNNLVNGKAAISPEMAIRLDKAFGGGRDLASPAGDLRPRSGRKTRRQNQSPNRCLN